MWNPYLANTVCYLLSTTLLIRPRQRSPKAIPYPSSLYKAYPRIGTYVKYRTEDSIQQPSKV